MATNGMQRSGYLAIWSDLLPEDHTDWAHWITREHAAERLGVPGFLECRIFRALGTSVNRYFILYWLERPEVVGSPDYLARLNAPTPWSQSIMPRLQNFARGGGRVIASSGTGQGGILAAVPLEAALERQGDAICQELTVLDRIVATHVLATDLSQTSIQTREKSMRGEDKSFAGLLLIEGLDEDAVRDALARIRPHISGIATGIEQSPLYRSFFGLRQGAG
jgi:hypothetical protein